VQNEVEIIRRFLDLLGLFGGFLLGVSFVSARPDPRKISIQLAKEKRWSIPE